MRRPVCGARLVTISEAARKLEIESPAPEKWLLRRIRQCEEDTGAKLLVLTGKSTTRPRYRVSLVKLRKLIPELFDIEGEAADLGKAIGNGLGKIVRLQHEMSERLDALDAKLAGIKAHTCSRCARVR